MSGIHNTTEKVHETVTPHGTHSTTEKVEHTTDAVDGQRGFLADVVPHSHHDHHTHEVKTDAKPITLVDTTTHAASTAAIASAHHDEVLPKTDIKPDATKIDTIKTDTTKIDTLKTDATKTDAKTTAKDIVEKVKDVTGLNK